MAAAGLKELHRGLEAVGFKKRAGQVFTIEVADGVLGWLGLNRASRHRPPGEVEINPVVGVRHQAVEQLVAELRGEKFHPYQPPTVNTPLGYLMPDDRYRAWIITDDAEEQAADLVAAVEHYAMPFMKSTSDLAALCRRLDERMGFDHQLVYRRPVAWLLAGDIDRASALLEAAEADLGERDDAAASELRQFAAAFRRRIEVSSSG